MQAVAIRAANAAAVFMFSTVAQYNYIQVCTYVHVLVRIWLYNNKSYILLYIIMYSLLQLQ